MCLLMYLELRLMSRQTVVAKACCFLEKVVKRFCCGADACIECDVVRGIIYPVNAMHTKYMCLICICFVC